VPELAVLSVMVHAEDANAEDIGRAAADAVRDLDKIYSDVIAAVLARVDRALMEKVMGTTNYEYQSDIARQWFGDGMAKGVAKGKAEVLLKLLQLKGFTLSEAERAHVLGCTEEPALERWIERVMFARSLDEVFAD
jgi:hypothetical protein